MIYHSTKDLKEAGHPTIQYRFSVFKVESGDQYQRVQKSGKGNDSRTDHRRDTGHRGPYPILRGGPDSNSIRLGWTKGVSTL